jgi:ABC-type transport system involved in cytochrome c biogenesis ATPase subunit
MPDTKLLQIYLNDHLAGATAGCALARRALSNNEGTDLGTFLRQLVVDLEEDKAALVELIDRLGLKKSIFKQSAGWMAEKAGRLKLNGQITGYSDLSRLLELEGLTLGIQGKLSLWENLKTIADRDPKLATFDLDRMIERARAQQMGVEQYRAAAAATALG